MCGVALNPRIPVFERAASPVEASQVEASGGESSPVESSRVEAQAE
jgi:hypothetical protein